MVGTCAQCFEMYGGQRAICEEAAGTPEGVCIEHWCPNMKTKAG